MSNNNTSGIARPITPTTADLICLSHLRWDFVYQRPQHLMTRFAREGRVFYFEEPIFGDFETTLDISERGENLFVCLPRINENERENSVLLQKAMLQNLVKKEAVKDFVLWYYTPTAIEFTDELKPAVVVFDCMDELSAFKFAPPSLLENERRLLEKADLVFTGGQSLYEAKKDRHECVFAFPSSIDFEHFSQARKNLAEPADQKVIARPKIGFAGVIDERTDVVLLAEIADLRPDWQFVMIGPVVKIAPEDLPRRSNIYYLGGKDYADLPAYIGGWDIAMMPFALNDSTKFISPTKTPEYLAAGKPVISTPIRDVVKPYGEKDLVQIIRNAGEFAAVGDKILERGNFNDWQIAVDEFLSRGSWDKTFEEMRRLIFEDTSAVARRA